METGVETAKDYLTENQEQKALGWLKLIANNIFAEGDDKMLEYHTKIFTKIQELREKYPNTTQYRMYHVLSSSTPSPEIPCSYYDFPGEDSVEEFLTNLFEKKRKAAKA